MVEDLKPKEVFVPYICIYGETRRRHMDIIRKIRSDYYWYTRHIDKEIPIDKKFITSKS